MDLFVHYNYHNTGFVHHQPWGHAVLFPQHLGFFLEVPLQRLGKAFPTVFCLGCVSLLLRPQGREHLGLAVAGAFLDIHQRLKTTLLLNDSALLPA